MAGEKAAALDNMTLADANPGLARSLGQPADAKKGTAGDEADMFRMGKTQELRRNFRLISMLGFSMILMSSWESALATMSIGLVAGGRAGYIFISFISWMSLLLINTTMAEMGSMAPTTGGQYHWVSEFAPKQYQKLLSYLMGWICVLGWQTGAAAGAFLTGTMIQGLLVLNYPTYVYESWHGTLLMIAMGLFSVFFNTVLARKLPMIEGLVLMVHIGAFFGIIVTLWVLAPRADPSFVFTQFSDNGWHNLGLSTLSGITAGINPLIGADGAVHMSEELQDAAKVVPKSMIWSTFLNGALYWIMIVTVCSTMGSLEDDLASATGYPFIQVFYNATGSKSSTTAMAVFVLLVFMACTLTTVATASRQLYAFARDSGLPYSPWLSQVKWDIPMNATIVTCIFVICLSLINLGSSTALNNIISLETGALLSSYIISISCVAWRRISGNPLPQAKFSLGRFGLPMNLASVALLVVFFVLSFFPAAPNPDAAAMNWSILMYGGVVVFSIVFYYFRGRHQYAGPVEYVRKLE